MKNRIYILCIILLLPLAGSAQNHFREGEKFVFQVYFGLINAGQLNTSLEMDTLRGKKVFFAQAFAKTVGLADRLFQLRERYEGYFDTLTLLPYRSIRDIKEGNYTRYNVVDYYHDSLSVTSLLSGKHEVPGDIRDMTSVFYYVRNIDFNSLPYDHEIHVNTFFDDDLFPFNVRYRGKETIKTRMGEYNCIKLVPIVEPGRIFKHDDDMTLWITDDPNRVPVRVKFDLIVGSVKCDLIEYSGLKY